MNKDLIYLLKYLLHQSIFNYKQIKYYNNLKNIKEGEIINEKISQFDNKITNKLLDYIALDNIIEERIKKEFSEESEKEDNEELNCLKGYFINDK